MKGSVSSPHLTTNTFEAIASDIFFSKVMRNGKVTLHIEYLIE